MRWVWLILAGLLVGVTQFSLSTPAARWDFEDAAQRAQWERSGLWTFVTQTDLSREPPAVRAFPTPTTAAYFGVVRDGLGSYDTGGREQGELRSPVVAVGPGRDLQVGDLVRVKFFYFRQVEDYAGAYDQTAVYIYFRDQAGRYWNAARNAWQQNPASTRVFYRDSSHPSSTAWQTFESEQVEVPTGAVEFRITFVFDSVDHLENGYLGWLIDNVEVHRAAVPLQIETEQLAEGWVRAWYFDQLRAKGGTPPYEWAVAPGSRLPAGLVLNRATGVLEGVPTESGTFAVDFVLKDSGRSTVQKRLELVIRQVEGAIEWVRGYWGLHEWARTGLWHTADPLGVGEGAYYAVPGQGTYATGGRTQGYLTSPEIPVGAYRGRDLLLSFLHALRVEHYSGGAYDKTEVQVRFYDGTRWGEWTTVWHRDSRDPSDRFIPEWVTVFLQVPATANRMQVRFGFDSVDGTNNDYEGWFVRFAGLFAFRGPLEIVTDRLPGGEAGVPYWAQVEARGGVEPYRWTATGLPEGLGMDRTAGRIQGTPRRAGTYTVRVTVEDAEGTAVVRQYTLEVRAEQVTLFAEPFDDFVDGAQWLPLPGHPSLWRVVDEVWHEGQNLVAGRGRVAYYGHGEPWDPNYDIGERTTGTLTSRPIPLEGAAHITVSFDYWRQVESYAGEYDQTYVQIRFTGGEWKTLWYRDSRDPSEATWTTYTSPGITVPAGATTVQIRFVFDSVDRFNNRYVGWLVDNVRIRKAATGSPLAALEVPSAVPREGGTRLQVFNTPNPIRDVRTTTFAVRGVEAEAIRVEVYDLAGRLVFRGEAAGGELIWHTDDLLGRYLANGVYLWRAWVKVGGTWVASDLKRLAILR